MSRTMSIATAVIVTAVLALAAGCSPWGPGPDWAKEELRLIESLSLENLPPLPADPSNRVADDPAAARLGEALFFDMRLSGNGRVACASCHLPERQFQDGLALARGVGTTNRRTMPIAGMGHSPWLFWDGRKDSLWSQALGPLESAVEHGTDRTAIAWLVAAHYAQSYQQVFGPFPSLEGLPPRAAPSGPADMVAAWEGMDESARDAANRVFANVGKAIAAFERSILPGQSRFDRYASALSSGQTSAHQILTEQELEGLRIFIGKGSCINCHNGPLFTDNHFHNTGVPAVSGLPEDTGRAAGALAVGADPFNCLGRYSDAAAEDCAELRFMTTAGHELERAYKAPSLRNVASRPPYMHAGQISTLARVVEHYNRAPAAPAGHSELRPLGLAPAELAALEAFLRTLDEEVSTYRVAGNATAATSSHGTVRPDQAQSDIQPVGKQESSADLPR